NLATTTSITFTSDDLTDFDARFVRIRMVSDKLPLTVTNANAILDLERQVSQQSDDTGASLQLITAKDDVFDISVDASSLPNDETLTVTSVTTLNNLPFTSLIAAFEISPHDAETGPALTINAHFKSALPSSAVAFGYNQTTGEYFLLPWKQSGG